jgi:DNA-binding NtrC family response regulator
MTMRARILIVEDDDALRDLLREELEDAGYEVETGGSLNVARKSLDEQMPELVVSDLRLPDGEGMDLLGDTASVDPAPGFVMITAYGSVGTAVRALKAGADDFLTKPLDVDHLLVSVSRVLEHHRTRAEVRRYRSMLDENGFHGLIGHSEAMRVLVEQIRTVAGANGPILILGESGTGKELVARAVHSESNRCDGPFLAVNCAGVPAELLESEFFGHVAGAFTGAAGNRRGLFDEADGGILFLDEIGDMPASMQAKLLRVLQDGRIRPVGGKQDHHVDVRVVAATHQDLDRLRNEGRFREDLYFRLETFILHVPPLRERDDDVELLTGRFLRRCAAAQGREAPGVGKEVLRRLGEYSFPGNVRELQNAVERAVTFCRGEVIGAEHLPSRMRGNESEARAFGQSKTGIVPLAEVARRHVRQAVSKTGGNKRRAASLLGISRRTLYRYLDET